MPNASIKTNASSAIHWLRGYYFARFAFSAVWVVLAITIARTSRELAAVMLIGYPVWDAVANYVDASRTGGVSANKSQLLNFIVSLATAAAVAIALLNNMHTVLLVFGVWAVFSGLLQMVTAVRRWKAIGAQWAMVLSGAQSMIAGAFMAKIAVSAEAAGIANIAPYAAFGAFYFLVSAILVTFRGVRSSTAHDIA